MSGRDDANRENLARLHRCPGPHIFALLHHRGEISSRARYACARCGGEVNERAATWYSIGLKHGLGYAEQRYAEAAVATTAAAQRDGAAP